MAVFHLTLVMAEADPKAFAFPCSTQGRWLGKHLPLLPLVQERLPELIQRVGPTAHLHALVAIVINHITVEKGFCCSFPKPLCQKTEKSNFRGGKRDRFDVFRVSVDIFCSYQQSH